MWATSTPSAGTIDRLGYPHLLVRIQISKIKNKLTNASLFLFLTSNLNAHQGVAITQTINGTGRRCIDCFEQTVSREEHNNKLYQGN
jgi:hypothetical protein